MKQQPIKIRTNTGKKGKRHSLIVGALGIAIIVAFAIRTFPMEVASMLGVDEGMLKQYSDHIIGFGIAAIFLYMGFVMILHPVVGITFGMVGLIVAYFEYRKLTSK